MYARDTECRVTPSIDRPVLRALPAALAVCTLGTASLLAVIVLTRLAVSKVLLVR